MHIDRKRQESRPTALLLQQLIILLPRKKLNCQRGNYFAMFHILDTFSNPSQRDDNPLKPPENSDLKADRISRDAVLKTIPPQSLTPQPKRTDNAIDSTPTIGQTKSMVVDSGHNTPSELFTRGKSQMQYYRSI